MKTKFKNLRLIPLSVKHIDYVMSWVNDPETVFYFSAIKEGFSREEELEYIENITKSEADRVFSIFNGTRYIGQVAINKIDRDQSGQGRLFIVIKKEYRRRGYASETIERIQDFVFKELGLNRLYLMVRPENDKALDLYHECGFRIEGTLYEVYKLNGKFINMMQLAIIKRWWKTRRNRERRG